MSKSVTELSIDVATALDVATARGAVQGLELALACVRSGGSEAGRKTG